MVEDLRPAVEARTAQGRLPDDERADARPARADRWQTLVDAVHADGPVTDAEATALGGLFPENGSDSSGVAWTLVHVVESAPGWPSVLDQLRRSGQLDGPWAEVLRRRSPGPPG